MHQTSLLATTARAGYRDLAVTDGSGHYTSSLSPETACACACRDRANRQRQQARRVQRQRQQA